MSERVKILPLACLPPRDLETIIRSTHGLPMHIDGTLEISYRDNTSLLFSNEGVSIRTSVGEHFITDPNATVGIAPEGTVFSYTELLSPLGDGRETRKERQQIRIDAQGFVTHEVLFDITASPRKRVLPNRKLRSSTRRRDLLRKSTK